MPCANIFMQIPCLHKLRQIPFSPSCATPIVAPKQHCNKKVLRRQRKRRTTRRVAGTPSAVLFLPGGTLPWKVHGISGSTMGWRWGTPPSVNRQTPVKTVPSPILRIRAGKISHFDK